MAEQEWQDAFEGEATAEQLAERVRLEGLDKEFAEMRSERPLASQFAKDAKKYGGRKEAAAAFLAAERDYESARQYFDGIVRTHALEAPPKGLTIGKMYVFRQTPPRGPQLRVTFVGGPLAAFRHWSVNEWMRRPGNIIQEYQIAAIQEGNLAQDDKGLHSFVKRWVAIQGQAVEEES